MKYRKCGIISDLSRQSHMETHHGSTTEKLPDKKDIKEEGSAG